MWKEKVVVWLEAFLVENVKLYEGNKFTEESTYAFKGISGIAILVT
jgi:hypothetical protein